MDKSKGKMQKSKCKTGERMTPAKCDDRTRGAILFFTFDFCILTFAF
jgi:hypothetical protein